MLEHCAPRTCNTESQAREPRLENALEAHSADVETLALVAPSCLHRCATHTFLDLCILGRALDIHPYDPAIPNRELHLEVV